MRVHSVRTRPIPPPSKKESSSLCKAMKLLHDKQSFSNATAYLRQLSAEWFDESLSISHQDPQQVEAFVAKAIGSFPLFKNYENAWPVRIYLRKHLKIRASHSRSVQPSASGAVKEKENIIPTTEKRSIQGHRKATRSATGAAARQAVGEHTKAPHGQSPTIVASTSSATYLPSSSTASQTSSYALRSRSQTNSFSAFLQALTPNLLHLAPHFEDAGVTEQASFRSLCGWPKLECERFLKEDVGLNLFQFRQVRIALMGLKNNSSST
ncbi:hypothetical protein AcV7_007952 [Taiwanofungus camphoratus]|nr:hypothetical protein AcV7_007952 [Antrodia cinnamomea]